jgi:hypothetical protein
MYAEIALLRAYDVLMIQHLVDIALQRHPYLVVPAPGIEPRTLGLRGTTAIRHARREFQNSDLLIRKSLLGPSAESVAPTCLLLSLAAWNPGIPLELSGSICWVAESRCAINRGGVSVALGHSATLPESATASNGPPRSRVGDRVACWSSGGRRDVGLLARVGQ